MDLELQLKRLTTELAGLRRLGAAERAARARRLRAEANSLLAAIADEAVWELTRTATYPEAAQILGVTPWRINQAAKAHRQRERASAEREPPGR